MKIYPLKKTLLTSSLIALLAAGACNASDLVETEIDRTYIDPISGETKQATRLLSEMTDTEKALLSNEEYRALQELESGIEADTEAETDEENTGE